MAEQKKLFENFPPVTTGEWMARIKADLKGEDPIAKLAWQCPEGFTVMPFHRHEDTESLGFTESLPGAYPWLRGKSGNGNSWLVRQDIIVGDCDGANRKAIDILMKGVDSLGFIIEKPEALSQASVDSLLKGIHAESIEINFRPEGKAKEILAFFLDCLDRAGADNTKIRGAIEADPLGRIFRNGKLCVPVEEGLTYLADLTRCSLELPLFRTVNINGSWLADAGADTVTELALALSMGNEYMSILTERGITAKQAASKIRFSFGIGSNYFFEIAKLRAARLLWALITEAYLKDTCEETAMEIHSVTCRWNKSEKDPYVNLLRTQTEAMSAALGGASSITVEPFDISFRKADDFSERIARNQQLLLKEEAYFDKVSDPAGGSWYIEKMTSVLADEAWKLFLEIEEKGGYLSAFNEGFVNEKIAACREKRNVIAGARKDLYGK
jgi:methylmalonyl-CoA mutase